MGTLVCRIELDKKKGVLLTVENGDDQITQTIVMDGTMITTTVKGSDETSTITQKQDSIAMKCKTFTLDAETITCKSTKETLHESGQNFDIKSGKNIGVVADSAAEYKAMNTTIESTSQTEIKGVTLALSGSASAELKGASIKLDAKGLMDLVTSGAATLKGSIVNIKGLLKLG
jgi:hypothetical protein